MSAASTKPLFKAIKPKKRRDVTQGVLPGDYPEQFRQEQRDTRDPLDYDPTPPDATAAALSVLAERMRAIGGPVFESAVGAGHIAYVLRDWGFDVIGADVVDRGYPGVVLQSFYDFRERPSLDDQQSRIMFTNPPYCEINSRDGHGRWLRHAHDLGFDLVVMLLNADWSYARQNGLDELHARYPVSVEYKCCWKIDFRGGGSPPQRNAWLIWDVDHQGETISRRLFRDAGGFKCQGVLL